MGIPGVEYGAFSDLLRRSDMFIFEFGLTTQAINDPVRTGRRASPLDERRLRVVERLFRQATSIEEETRPQGAEHHV